MEKLTISVIAKKFSNETAAYELLEEMRWPNGPECPHCGSVNRAYFINAKSRRITKAGNASFRRLWKCAECKKQFSVLVGTIFHRSHVPLSKWLMALYMMSASKNGVAAYEVHRTLGVTNKTAWFMMHRIREAMKRGELAESMTGIIIADETYIGGAPKNRHHQGKAKVGKHVVGTEGKQTAVLTLVNKLSGEARSRVMADVTGATLEKAIAEQVNVADSFLYTDGLMAYRQLGRQFRKHEFVDHSAGEYVRGTVTTNHAEGFFSQLKRSVDGTHHRISVEHLPRYLAEFDFRYSTRKLTDTQRMERMVGQAGGRRLTYKATR